METVQETGYYGNLVHGMITTLAAVIGSFLLFRVLRDTFVIDRHRKKLPPGPWRIPFPINVLVSILVPGRNLTHELASFKKWYGDLVMADVDGRPRFIVQGSELVREIFVKNGDVTSGRNRNIFLQRIVNYDRGIVFNDGRDLQTLRRFAFSALRKFGMGKRSIEHKIMEEADMLRQVLADKQGKIGFDPSNFLDKAVSNVICSITFGDRFEYDDPVFLALMRQIRVFFSTSAPAPFRILFERFPGLILSPLFAAKRKDDLRSLKDFIDEQVQRHDETFDGDNLRDIIDAFLAESRRLGDSNTNDCFRRNDIWMCIFDLFLAGTETTSTSLLWFFVLMAGHRNVQEKVIREVDFVIGQERSPAYEDKKCMPYTEATLTEILRYRPVAPMAVPHRNTEDVTVRGRYIIPKGSEIWMNVLGTHHDPEVFPGPDEFDPTRFLSADEKTFVKNDAFIAFGTGHRSCLGEQLAKMVIFLYATSILQRFTISLATGAIPDYSIDHCFRVILPRPFRVTLTKRM